MADSGSSEEVAVIGNTDITSAESENNIINTVVLLVIFCDRNVWEFFKKKAWFHLRKLSPNRPNATAVLARRREAFLLTFF